MSVNVPSLLPSPVSLVIARDDVQQHQEPAALRQLSEAHPDRRKHSPGKVWTGVSSCVLCGVIPVSNVVTRSH